MEVTKGELYFREKLGGVQDAAGVNSLVLEWVESVIQDTSLLGLSEAFMPYGEQVMDIIWLLSQEGTSDALASFLVHFISSGKIAYLSKLAIERLDAELLEKAGVITQAAALMKKTGRINTQLHYKYQKNMFLKAEEMEVVGKEMESAVKEQSRTHFFWTVGKWELDLNRALDILMNRAGAEDGVRFLLEILLLSGEKIKEFLQLRFLLQWHSPHYMREQVMLSCQIGTSLMEKGIVTFDELEKMTWPRTAVDAKLELDNWMRSIKAGSVIGESAPFYEPLEEYRKVCEVKVKNQRVLLYQLLCEDEQRFQALSRKMVEEEPFLEWFRVTTVPKECLMKIEEQLMKRISRSGPMPWLHDELWGRISEMPVESRFALYERWDSQSEPSLLYSRSLSLMSVKRFLRRLSRENVRQYCRLLGKVSHGNPVTVLTALVEQVMVYDNLTAPVIESLRYLTVLEFDVLSFALVRVLERALRTRRSLKEGTSMLAPWVSNLANFVACLFKRYGNGLGELGKVLNRIYELMLERQDGFVLIVFVAELLREMAGIGSPEDTNDRILLAKMAGGPQLQKLLAMMHGESVEEDTIQRSSKRLFSALKSSGLLLKMYFCLCQVRESLLYGSIIHGSGSSSNCNESGSSSWYHVKVVGEFADRAAWTMQQYAEFLCVHHKHRFSADDLNPLLEEAEDNEYIKYLKRRLLSSTTSSNNNSSISGLYEEEIAKLAAGENPNDKLKKRLLEEELKGITCNSEDCVKWSERIKRALISVPDAWEMAATMKTTDYAKLEQTLKLIVPWLTPYEAHNLGKFLDRLKKNAIVRVIDVEEDGVQSVSSTISKGIEKLMMMTTTTDMMEVVVDDKEEESVGMLVPVTDDKEDGEMQVNKASNVPQLLEEIIFRALLAIDQTNIDGGEDEVYVLRRNLMIILWHLKDLLIDLRDEDVKKGLQAVIERIKEEEDREDLRVMASRVITIFPIKSIIEESIEPLSIVKPIVDQKRGDILSVDRKRKLQDYASDDEEAEEVKKKVKFEPPTSTSKNNISSSGGSSRRHEPSTFSGSSSRSSRDGRDYNDRKRYEDSYYSNSSSRHHRR